LEKMEWGAVVGSEPPDLRRVSYSLVGSELPISSASFWKAWIDSPGVQLELAADNNGCRHWGRG
ncbi:hypothetical protein ACLOJK_022989, partial [Asimina triloba]